MESNPHQKQLKQSIHESKVQRARQQDPDEKLFEGARLYDMARKQTLSAIAADHPEWSPEQISNEYSRRLQVVREREEAGVYTVVGTLGVSSTDRDE